MIRGIFKKGRAARRRIPPGVPKPDLFGNLDPKNPFKLTEMPPPEEYLDIAIMHGPLYNNTDLFQTFCYALRLVRAGIAAARAAPRIEDEGINSFVQLLIASSLLAACEAQALLALVTTGQTASSRVHLRALGEVALRVRLFRRDLQLAKDVYRSYVASQLAVAKGLLPEDHELVVRLDELLQREVSAAEKGVEAATSGMEAKSQKPLTDRRLTGKVSKSNVSVAEMSSGESDSWSKWSHGEITALAEIARRLDANRSVPVEEAAGNDGQGEFYLFRGVVFLWLLILSLCQVVNLENAARDLMERIKREGRQHGWTVQ